MRRLVFVCLTLAALSCGGGDSTPTGPSVTTITIGATGDVITGTFDLLWSAPGALGDARLSAELRSMTRSSAALRAPLHEQRYGSVADLISAFRH